MYSTLWLEQDNLGLSNRPYFLFLHLQPGYISIVATQACRLEPTLVWETRRRHMVGQIVHTRCCTKKSSLVWILMYCSWIWFTYTVYLRVAFLHSSNKFQWHNCPCWTSSYAKVLTTCFGAMLAIGRQVTLSCWHFILYLHQRWLNRTSQWWPHAVWLWVWNRYFWHCANKSCVKGVYNVLRMLLHRP